jgi:hypothetical protein
MEDQLVHQRGFVLQLDCPDLAMERVRFFQDDSLDQFQKMVELHVEAINQAVAGIPREMIRLHVCWGNYDGPHTHDVSLEPLLPIIYRARVGALSLPLASPRHQHELKAFRAIRSPDAMLPARGRRLHDQRGRAPRGRRRPARRGGRRRGRPIARARQRRLRVRICRPENGPESVVWAACALRAGADLATSGWG